MPRRHQSRDEFAPLHSPDRHRLSPVTTYGSNLHFSGEIRRVSFPGLELTDVRSSSECARRMNRHLAGDRQQAVALLLVRHGNIQLDQYHRHSSPSPGTFTLLDLKKSTTGFIHARLM